MLDLNQFEDLYLRHGSAMCFKGGGGSSSGKVGFPAYMETLHGKWLDSSGTDALVVSMADAMNAAHGNSPWTLKDAYDPDSDISAWDSALTAYKAILTGVDDVVDWAALYTQADTSVGGVIEADIAADISAYADQIDDEIETKVLPRFRRGMQDINAVVSSAFPIGEALIEANRNRDVAKHGTSVRINLMDRKGNLIISGTDQMLKLMLGRLGFEEGYAKSIVESNRIKIVAKSEQAGIDTDYDKYDALWDLEVFQYGGNLLGAIGGGVVKPGAGPSKVQSALGGAMSGASAGAMVGGPVGAVVGGVLGAASAFL